MTAVASERRPSRYLRSMGSPNQFAATPTRPKGPRPMASTAPPAPTRDMLDHESPVCGLACDLNSSLHLDSDSGSPSLPPMPLPPPPAFEQFDAVAPLSPAGLVTPVAVRSLKRPMRDLGSPGMAPPAQSPSVALWARSRGRRAATSLALGPPLALATPGSPFTARTPATYPGFQATPGDPPTARAPATHPGFHPGFQATPGGPLTACAPATHPGFLAAAAAADDDSSFDGDGSLTSLPRMRGSAIRTILEDRALDCTPLQSQASRIKRVRGQGTAIPSFLPLAVAAAAPTAEDILSPCFSPSARSQPECHLLPCDSASTDSIMRVDAETVSHLLAGAYNRLYDERIVVDCRFPYEYEGGHIAGAVNAPTLEALERLLLERRRADRRVVVVLHCEYSLQRAPSMACHLRRRDRELNMHRYPHLDYPEIYVLKGGYRNFFGAHRAQCEPQSYVEMNDSQFVVDCRERMLHFNRTFKRTKSTTDTSLARSFSATVAGNALFTANIAPSPTPPARSAAASLPARARRLGRTQSARPGINLIDFSQR
ncbi:m-phase inducer phosphatase [Coemansia spiralis]|nr:m-phase inducer phosphatase [Coemansia spiralis]